MRYEVRNEERKERREMVERESELGERRM